MKRSILPYPCACKAQTVVTTITTTTESKAPTKRTEYMRDYMARKRAEAKQAQVALSVVGWFVVRSSTGEILQHVNVSTTSNGVTFAGLAWRGVFAYQWTKTGDKVIPFFNQDGAVQLAKAVHLLSGEACTVIKRIVA